MNCLLCQAPSPVFVSEAFLCPCCGLLFKNPEKHPTLAAELARYSTHKNNEQDPGYVDFLRKLANPLAPFLPTQFSALDFGCGPGPTLCNLLKQCGGEVENYDPIFFPSADLLNKRYEVVTSSEVVEHFKNPKDDWSKLISLVEPGGILAIMTLFWNEAIDYKSWWYKNDFTHVVFYQQKTVDYLAAQFNLEVLFNDKNSVIIFKKIKGEK